MRDEPAYFNWELVWLASKGSRYLAAASLLVLLGGASWIVGRDVIGRTEGFFLGVAFLGLTGLGVVFFVVGWLPLGEMARSVDRRNLFFPLSVLAAVLGFVPFLFVLPSFFLPPVLALLSFWLWAPFLPSVFAPVVAFHAGLFLLLWRKTPRASWPSWAVFGGVFLLALALLTLSLQIAGGTLVLLQEAWFALLPGLAFVGCGILAWSWREEYEGGPHRPQWGGATKSNQ